MSILTNAVFSNGMTFPEAKKYVRQKFGRTLSPRAKGMMNDIASGFMCGRKDYHSNVFKSFDRITFDASNMIDQVSGEQCSHYEDIHAELNSFGYVILDYIEGTCKRKESDDRIFKIGKILTKSKSPKELIDGFANSSIRSGKNKKGIYITLTINPLDVALMSTFQGWESCMSYFENSGYDDDGEYVTGRYDPEEEDEEEDDMYNHVSVDILSGTIVAYVHETLDFDPTKTMGRYLLKPYFGFKKNPFVFYNTENNGYGTMPNNIRSIIKEAEKEINSKLIKNGKSIYVGTLGRGLYNDSMSDKINYTSMSLDEIFEKKDSIKDYDSFIMNIISTSEEHNFLLDDKFKDYKSYIDINRLKLTEESYKWLCEDFRDRVIIKGIMYSGLPHQQKMKLLEYMKQDSSGISFEEILQLVIYDESLVEVFKNNPEYETLLSVVSDKTEAKMTKEHIDILDKIYTDTYYCRNKINLILLNQFNIGNEYILGSNFIKGQIFPLGLMNKMSVFNMSKEQEKSFLLEDLRTSLRRYSIFNNYAFGGSMTLTDIEVAKFINEYFGVVERGLRKFITKLRDDN